MRSLTSSSRFCAWSRSSTHATGVHHDEAVAVPESELHVVRDHERREAALRHERGGELHDRRGDLGVERRRVFVEK